MSQVTKPQSSELGGEKNPIRIHGYPRLLSGFFVATLALWVHRLAMSFFVWQITQSAFWTTAVAAVQFIPSAIFGPFFGVIVDRIPLRRAINLALGITCLGYALTALAYSYGVTIPWAYALLAVWIGIGTAFYAPARLVLPAAVVPKSALPAAIALSATSFNLTRILGPFLGATLIAFFGVGTTLITALVIYASFFPISWSLNLASNGARGKTHGDSLWSEFTEGIDYIKSTPALLGFLVIAVMSSLFVRSMAELAPVLNGLKFDGAEFSLSLLTLAPAIGAIISGVLLGRLGGNFTRLRLVMILSVTLGPLTGWIAGVFNAFPIIFFALLGNGLLGSFASVGSQTLIQTQVRDELRARVMSIWASLALGSIALAAACYGAIIDWFGLTATFSAIGCIGFFAGLALVFQERPKH